VKSVNRNLHSWNLPESEIIACNKNISLMFHILKQCFHILNKKYVSLFYIVLNSFVSRIMVPDIDCSHSHDSDIMHCRKHQLTWPLYASAISYARSVPIIECVILESRFPYTEIPTSGLQNFSGMYLPEGFVGKNFEIKLLTDVVIASRRNFRIWRSNATP